jgi:hypothetical protein
VYARTIDGGYEIADYQGRPHRYCECGPVEVERP